MRNGIAKQARHLGAHETHERLWDETHDHELRHPRLHIGEKVQGEPAATVPPGDWTVLARSPRSSG